MKRVLIVFLLSVAAFNAAAISEHHRKELANSGCTQVAEATGKCNATASTKQKVSTPANEADHVMNMSISTASEYLLSKGWKPNNGKWHKTGYTLTLMVEDDKVVNSQISK
ncbi:MULTISPECIES: hypothetical protein [Enterobacter]|uniref:hypothetical protein n=1 Tax=Enterobacter TaxID=547 RepID=UPI0010572D32|nr:MULTISPECIES: hypothetical protein [Enterobacter cloacae complex]HDT2074265.1 hypothetical protein [Enterobacter roggenkampii]HEG2001389.1 hypothetical protein [Enterobacter asburiae]MCD2459847.1 hypothetical protein [Enterobacter cloacae complex sp. 2021EL-01261]MDT9874244.1 hypothetical protein [Enterobacter cloacae]HDT2093702.1 hypothetical protein [Enterobacter roggenkampii]